MVRRCLQTSTTILNLDNLMLIDKIESMKSSAAMGCAKQIKTWIHGTRHEAQDEASHKANIKDAQYTSQPARGGDR